MKAFNFKEGEEVRVVTSRLVATGIVKDRTMFTEIGSNAEAPAYFVTFPGRDAEARWFRENALFSEQGRTSSRRPPKSLRGDRSALIAGIFFTALAVGVLVIWGLLT